MTSCIGVSIIRAMSEIRLQVGGLLNYSEGARMLKVTRATIYAMIRRGELHPFVIADRRYLLREEVERLTNDRHGNIEQIEQVEGEMGKGGETGKID